MEGVLLALGSHAKNADLREAVNASKEAVKNLQEKADAPAAYVREKCLAAFELAFDHGNEKAQHAAVEGVQCLLRDRRFHTIGQEKPEHSLPVQILQSFTGIAQWGNQLQCHCMTLIVELLSSSELMPSLSEVEEAIELCMRVFGSSREESARMSSRAAVSQSITSYCSNRYNVVDCPQDSIAVYLDVTSLLEVFVKLLTQMKTSNEQSIIVLDATQALLSAQPLSILTHNPFLNLLWEQLCPLLIRLLGVPQAPSSAAASNSSVSSLPGSLSTVDQQPLGQGQMAQFTLSPAVLSNPEASRALYLIVEQLLRLFSAAPSMNSVLEAVFHKAFLFPKIEQRTEAMRVIRKILAEPRRLADIVSISISTNSLSLWRMLIVCIVESASPQYDVCIEAIRALAAMLQGMLLFCQSDQLLSQEAKERIQTLFPSLQETDVESFSVPIRDSVRPSVEAAEAETTDAAQTEEEEELAEKLRSLERKFEQIEQEEKREFLAEVPVDPQTPPKHAKEAAPSETATATRFVRALCDQISEWRKLRSTTEVDAAILSFAASFFQEFSVAHSELFHERAEVQQEFLNTDAIYLTSYACLSLGLRGEETIEWNVIKRRVLLSGCQVYASESWLREVYKEATLSEELRHLKEHPHSSLLDLIKDYDGLDQKLLTDYEKLQKIRMGASEAETCLAEKKAMRWLITSAWEGIVRVLSSFLSVKHRRKTRPKVQEAIEHAIGAIQNLANVALTIKLGARCGWIFEKLVESSCDVDELRRTVSAEDTKRLAYVDKEDVLSIQLVLDHAFVALHAPECWKHVIRCTEYVWELEKYIYGSLCYDKPSRFSLSWKKPVKVEATPEEDCVPVADRSVETALGDGRGQPERDRVNRAICILIAKTDRFYSSCGGSLSLPSIQALLQALVSASENRILLQPLQSPSLTPADSLLGRLSEILSHFPMRPLVHQMLVWPMVAAHFVQVACSSADESRTAASVLTETVASLFVHEQPGQSMNQMLVAPFQTIMCTEGCAPETRTQLIIALADSVKERSDKLGSGWKPLFGSLRAVRTLQYAEGGARVAWTVLDVIGTYLGITKCSVLSWSLPDCIACVTHFLQSAVLLVEEKGVLEVAGEEQKESEASSTEENVQHEPLPTTLDSELSEAALKLVRPLYAVLVNLYRTPHIPNPHLLHRLDLRMRQTMQEAADCSESPPSSSSSFLLPPLSSLLDAVLSTQRPEDPSIQMFDQPLDVPAGGVPWDVQDKNESASSPLRSSHELASAELLLELVEQLCGALVTAPQSVQPLLIQTIQFLLTTIRTSEFDASISGHCVHSLLLPQVLAWTRRVSSEKIPVALSKAMNTNHRHAVGAATEIVCDAIKASSSSEGDWETRLLADILEVATECLAQPGETSRVGVAALRHVLSVASSFGEKQWMVLTKAFWDACPLVWEDLSRVRIVVVCPQDILAHERPTVFLVDAQREADSESDSDCKEAEVDGEEGIFIICVNGEHRTNISITYLVRALLAHQMLLQQVALLLVPRDSSARLRTFVPLSSSDEDFLERLSSSSCVSLLRCLQTSYLISLELDSRRGLRALLSKLLGIPRANLHKQAVAAVSIKMAALFALAEKEITKGVTPSDCVPLWRLCRFEDTIAAELRRVEHRTAAQKISLLSREHKETKYEFVLVEDDDEKRYTLVSESRLNQTVTEYRKQRPLGLHSRKYTPTAAAGSDGAAAGSNGAATRANPFTAASQELQKQTDKDFTEPLSSEGLRLVSLRECALCPIELLLTSSHFRVLFPFLLPPIKDLLLSSPDLTIRQSFLSLIEKYFEH